MLPYINTPFKPLAEISGASIDELKLIFSFLLSYPLAALLNRIPDASPRQKNVFIISSAIFYLIGLFDLWAGVRTILYSAAGTYAIAYYIDGSFMPWIGFLFLIGHMAINHLQRQFTTYRGAVDITGAQMVMLMKLTAFCWNVHDGRLRQETLTDHQRDKAILKMPSLLEFAGYVLFFPSMLAGPAFDFNDYKRWLDTTMFDLPPQVDPSKALPAQRRRVNPRRGASAAWKAVTGLIWICLFIKFSAWYGVKFVLSEGFARYMWIRRVWYVYMLGVTARMKYYGVWSLTEGSCILSGIGFNGVDPATGEWKWDRLENVRPYDIETAQNSRAYLGNWNKNTNAWLRNYVYLRVTPKGKTPGFRASLITFTTSAFWHGFYPGYYLTFILAAFIQTVAKNFRRHVRPFFMTPDGKLPTRKKKYYDLFSTLSTQFGFSFTVAPFIILGFSDSIKAWSSLYFYCIIGVVASMGFFASPGKRYLSKRLDARNGPRLSRVASSDASIQIPLGLPNDPGKEIEDALNEIKTEIQVRRRGGSEVKMPRGLDLKAEVESKLDRRKLD